MITDKLKEALIWTDSALARLTPSTLARASPVAKAMGDKMGDSFSPHLVRGGVRWGFQRSAYAKASPAAKAVGDKTADSFSPHGVREQAKLGTRGDPPSPRLRRILFLLTK